MHPFDYRPFRKYSTLQYGYPVTSRQKAGAFSLCVVACLLAAGVAVAIGFALRDLHPLWMLLGAISAVRSLSTFSAGFPATPASMTRTGA